MKRSTLILLLLAAVGGALVYFLEIKPGKARDEKEDTSKSAFSFKREDINSVSITRAGQTVTIDNDNNQWTIKQPVNARADESAVSSLTNELASAKVERTLPANSGDLKSYGLDNPQVTLGIKLKSGEQHTIKLGSKDFSGLAVYGQVDGSKDVAMIPISLFTNADKQLDDLRDKSLLGSTQYEISGLTLTNSNGRIVLAKKDTDWTIKSPIESAADDSEVSSLLSEIGSAKAAAFVSETADDLSKYGLDKPAASVTAQLQTGGERSILFGSKVENQYYAKASDRPQIVKVDSALFDKINAKLATLRSKEIAKIKKDEITRVEIRNPNLTLVAEKDKDKDKWVIKEPADKKDKEAQSYKLFDPIETNKASEIIDKPTAAQSKLLAKPAVEVKFTGKDGKTTVIKVSAADGDHAYVRVEGKPETYQVSKQMLDSWSFKIDDVVL
jgi:hypothetical protein